MTRQHLDQPSLPAAVLWDMDGTIVDTEPSWIAEEYLLVEEAGGRGPTTTPTTSSGRTC